MTPPLARIFSSRRLALEAELCRQVPSGAGCASSAAAFSPSDAAPLLELTLLTTNDLHSAATGIGADSFPASKRGGFAQLAQRIKAAQAAGPTLAVDAGDWFSGEIFSTLGPAADVAEVPELEFFSDCDMVATLGNHDFDAGVAGLETMLEKARARNLSLTMVASNLLRNTNLPSATPPEGASSSVVDSPQLLLPAMTQAYVVREYEVAPETLPGYFPLPTLPQSVSRAARYVAARSWRFWEPRLRGLPLASLPFPNYYAPPPAPIRVGILGAMGPDALMLSAATREAAPDRGTPTVSFVGYDDEAGTRSLSALIADLRAQVELLHMREHVDAIVLLLHGGEEEAEPIAAAIPQIDVIVSGHTHQSYYRHYVNTGPDGQPRSTHVVQCGHGGESIGRLPLVFDQKRRLRLAGEPSCDAVHGSDAADPAMRTRVRGWEGVVKDKMAAAGVASVRELVYAGPDGGIFNSSDSQETHAHVLGRALLRETNRMLTAQGQPPAHVYLTCPTCVRGHVTAVDGKVALQFSDVYRMFSFSVGRGVIVTNIRKRHLWVLMNAVAVCYRFFNPEWVLTVAGSAHDTNERGLPFVNLIRNLRLLNAAGTGPGQALADLPYDDWPDSVRIAANGMLGQYLWKLGDVTAGLLANPAMDPEGRSVSFEDSLLPGCHSEYELMLRYLRAEMSKEVGEREAAVQQR